MYRSVIIIFLISLCFLLLHHNQNIIAGEIDKQISPINEIGTALFFKTNSFDTVPSLFILNPSGSSAPYEKPYFVKIKQKQINLKKSRDIADSWGSLFVNSDPKILNDIASISFEMDYGAVNEVDYLQGFRQYDMHKYSFNVTGKLMDIEYGALYRSFDTEYERKQIVGKSKDKPGKELWIKKRFGFVSLKTFMSDYTDTVDFDQTRPRTSRNQIGSSIEFNIQNLPSINLSYTTGKSKKVLKGGELEVKNDNFQNFNLYAYYWKPKWDISLSTNLFLADERESNMKSKLQSLELRGNYRPSETISINPAIGIIDEGYDWSGGGLDYLTQYASVTLSYYPVDAPLGVMFYGYYSNYVGSDSYTDTNVFNGLAITTWNLGRNIFGNQSLSVEFGYYSYLDNAFSGNDYHEISSYVKYKVARF